MRFHEAQTVKVIVMNRFFEDTEGNQFSIEQIKENLKTLANADLKACLLKTDWQIVRAADPTSQKPVSQEVMDERQAARDLAVTIETQVESAQDVETLHTIYDTYL